MCFFFFPVSLKIKVTVILDEKNGIKFSGLCAQYFKEQAHNKMHLRGPVCRINAFSFPVITHQNGLMPIWRRSAA